MICYQTAEIWLGLIFIMFLALSLGYMIGHEFGYSKRRKEE